MSGKGKDFPTPHVGKATAAGPVTEELKAMQFKEAAKKAEDSIEETLTYSVSPPGHWGKKRTDSAIERLNREIRRRTRAAGALPCGNPVRMPVCAGLRHLAGIRRGHRQYMRMRHPAFPSGAIRCSG